MKVYAETDIGQKRQMNQDFVYVSEQPVGNLPNLFVVADGMGGHNAGDFASRFGVSVLVETVQKDTNFNPVKILRHGMEAANQLVLTQAKKDASMAGMGTTMVVATIVGSYAYIANVGDSRLYIGADSLKQITRDHSLIAEMVRIGELTPEEARNHPDKNIITRAIGTSEEVDIDFFDVKLEPKDQIVMCSDGLTNMVTDEEIYGTIQIQEGNKAQKLIEMANANGGKDNITVIIVEPFTNEVREC
ncbi:Stp1/IreP family PP2C-type Ser/Thr phosphatase [Blautia liquoris]|uniref:Stp1/IreP family PP2C-type Ser/Thr phosphatase n=1 Tax=Blautia liquoris TaxID=2779518 RepID=A0A7M2RIR0_9FIRM|nr:Stp1/IreP family PP2C-type Ser/Thr phosphatase [Blautia liquoris]QOV20216.1 Stp1/IreP family PP2C-type Ser/Thr phosphatase [Blautia liquoris]